LAARALWLCALLALIAASVLGVALPAEQANAQALGGRQFKLTSNGGGTVTLSWATGSGQTGFRLNRITSAGTVVVATPAGTATSVTDTLASTVTVACYQLEILNGTAVVGRSDILCVIANVVSGPSPVRNVAIQTNESPLAIITWQAPAAGTVIGYLVVPLGRTPLGLVPAGTTQAVDAPAGPTCYIVLTLIPDSAQVPFKIGGFSDIVCAFTNTFSPPNATATATGTTTRTNTPIVTNTPFVVTATVPTSTATNTTIPGTLTNTPITATVTGTSTLTPANLTITKIDTPDPVNVGENLVYTITIANTGGSQTGPIVFADNLPAGLTFSSATGTQGFSCFFTAQNNSVGCTASNLGGAGSGTSSATITVSTFVDNPCFVNSPITNVARVALGGSITATSPSATASTIVNGCVQATATNTLTRTPTNTPLNTSTPTVTSTPGVDLVISKFDAPDPLNANPSFVPGETPVALQYTLQITNAGNISASGVTVVDNLPTVGSWSFGSAAGDAGFVCNYDFGFIVTCTGGTIGANGGVTITIVLNVFDCAGGGLVNNATVDPANVIPEFNEGNNSAFAQTICGPAGAATATLLPTNTRTPTRTATATAVVTALPTTAASFLKTASVTSANFGQAFDYTLTYSNTSGATISGIQINDALPPEATFLGVTANSGFSCSHIGTGSDGTVICTGGTVASGASGTITITVAVTTCTSPLVNTATVFNPPMANNTSTTTTPVNGCVTVTPTNTLTTTPTLTRTATATATSTVTVTPATFDIGPVTKSPAFVAGNTGDVVAYDIAIPVTGTGTATWTAAQTSVRDSWVGFVRNATPITFSGWATNPVCTQTGAQINCAGGSIASGSTGHVFIELVATACAGLTNTATADPDNALAETNETNNTATATMDVACNTTITKAQSVNSVNTSVSAQSVTYTLTVDDILGSRVPSSTVTDTLPAGVVPQSATITTGSGGPCTITGQVVSCPNVTSSTNTAVITIVASVPTSTARGNYPNQASVTTAGDTASPTSLSNTVTLSVYPFDLTVTVTDTDDPVGTFSGVDYSYTVTVTNVSAGGFSANGIFIEGGLAMRDTSNGSLVGARNDHVGFADIVSVLSSQGTCTVGAGFGGNPDHYSCNAGTITAGSTVTVTVGINALAAEPDGSPDVGLDGTVSISAVPTGAGGGTNATNAPETNPALTQAPPSSMLTNNRDFETTDID